MPQSIKPAAACLLILIALASVAAQQNNPATPKTGTVRGTVINSITGEPVVRAHVVLTGFISTNIFGAITNSNGGFSIMTVPPGDYSVAATHRAYLAETKMESPPQITIKAGENLPALNIPLVPASVISGRIVDANDHPVPGMLVEALGLNIQGFAQSDYLGRFRIARLSSGRYLVKARSNSPSLPAEIRTDGTVEINYGTTYYPNTLNPESSVQVQTQPGRETSDVVIKMKTAPIVRVSGMVVSSVPDTKNISLMLGSNYSASGLQLDAINHFTIWRMDQGTHRLMASSYGNHLSTASLLVEVGDTNIDNLVLTLQPRFELNGNVAPEPSFNQTDKGEAERSQGKVVLMPAEPMTRLDFVNYSDGATTRTNGDFKFSNVLSGRYFVNVEGYPKYIYVKDVHAGPVKLENGVLDLRNGPPDQPLEVELGKDGSQITGAILHSDGTPALAKVVLLRQDSDGYKLLQQFTSFKAPYTFSSVAPGRYLLLGYESVPNANLNVGEFAALYRGLMEEVIVGSNETVTKDLRIRNSDSGQ